MANKLTNETIAKRLLNARKENTLLQARKEKAEETLRTFEADAVEVQANVDHFERLAAARGIEDEDLAELAAVKPKDSVES